MSRKPAKGEYIETVRPQLPILASTHSPPQDTGNKVSRRSQIIGTTNIILGGKTVIQAEVIIRGDLLRTYPPAAPGEKQPGAGVAVAIGRYCIFSRGCELKPPGKLYKGSILPYTNPHTYTYTGANTRDRAFSYYPLKIADHVFVGPGSVVEAALIGSHVRIGAGVVVGKFAIIKDFVRVLDGAVVPPNMVVPSFSIVAGRPARVVGELAEGEIEGFDLREEYRAVGNA
jgi:dynactin-5